MEEELKAGCFYWTIPCFDVDFTPPGFDTGEWSEELYAASSSHWWQNEQPALYLGDGKWMWLGTENDEWPAIWVGAEIAKPA